MRSWTTGQPGTCTGRLGPQMKSGSVRRQGSYLWQSNTHLGKNPESLPDCFLRISSSSSSYWFTRPPPSGSSSSPLQQEWRDLIPAPVQRSKSACSSTPPELSLARSSLGGAIRHHGHAPTRSPGLPTNPGEQRLVGDCRLVAHSPHRLSQNQATDCGSLT